MESNNKIKMASDSLQSNLHLHQSNSPLPNENKIFLTGFNPNPYTKETLDHLLRSRIPGYLNIIMPKEVYKGFAFIDVKTEEDVKKCLEMKYIDLEGHRMLLKEFKQGTNLKKQRITMNERKVFISQIPAEWTKIELEEAFSRYGPLEEIYMCFRKSQIKSKKKSENKKFKIGYAIYKNKKTAQAVYEKEKVVYKNVILEVDKVQDRAGLAKGGIKGNEGSLGQFNFDGPVCGEILRFGFENIFENLGIQNFNFEQFLKFSDFHLRQSKRILERRMLQKANQRPEEMRQESLFPKESRQKKKNQINERRKFMKKKFEKLGDMIEFHSLRPTSPKYHQIFSDHGFRLDHKLRNLRKNKLRNLDFRGSEEDFDFGSWTGDDNFMEY